MVRREAVSFGPFLFDPATGLLTKHGHRIKLQAKAAALLSRLLDEPGEVVSRVEIQKAMWPDGTNVDFELGIKVAAKKLRDALGDQSDEPTYIQTVYGEGYRFIAAVKPVSIPDLLPPTTPVPEVQEAPPPVASRRLLWVSALVVVIAALVIQGGASARRVPFQGRD